MQSLKGSSTPTFDVSQYYELDDIRDLLIRDTRLGKSLASYFSSGPDSIQPDHAVVLMRGHGYTVVAPSIEQCIFRAIYTKQNATIQTTSLSLVAAHSGGGQRSTHSGVQYLHDDELSDTAGISRTGWQRAWELWVREVEAATLYVQG